MPGLHLHDVPHSVYEQLQRLAADHHSTLEAETIAVLHRILISRPDPRSQAELLADLRRRSFTPPPGTPDSTTLLAEDRSR